MFYDRFIELCDKKGVKPSRVAIEKGFNKGSITSWKRNAEIGKDVKPTTEILEKIADYFNVSIDELLGNKKNLTEDDKEMQEYLEFLKYRPEGKMLFSVAKGCTKEEIEQAVKIIDALRKTDDD